MKGALPVGQMQPLTAVHAAWRVSVGWGPALLKLSFGTQPVTPASVLSADGPLVAFHAWLSSTLLASGSCCPPPPPPANVGVVSRGDPGLSPWSQQSKLLPVGGRPRGRLEVGAVR